MNQLAREGNPHEHAHPHHPPHRRPAVDGTAERTSPSSTRPPASRPACSTSPRPTLVDEVVRPRPRRLGGLGRRLARQAHQVLFAFRELLNERKEDIAALITAEHGKVLSDALGEVTRGLEVAEFACGIPHLHARAASPRTPRPTSTSTRSASRSASSRSSRRSTSRPWCRCGSSPSPSRAATPSCSSRREKDPSAALADRRAVEGGRPARRRHAASSTATRRPSTRC